jgi:hypothetical protein
LLVIDAVRSFNVEEKIPQARAVAVWLSNNVRNRDALVARAITDVPVRFHMERLGVAWPQQHPAEAPRILAITRTPDMDLDYLREMNFPAVRNLRPPRVAFQDGNVTVYALYPRTPPPPRAPATTR